MTAGNVSAALARVKELQARAAAYAPPTTTEFQAMLDEATAEAEAVGSLQGGRARSEHPPGVYTIGHLIGAPALDGTVAAPMAGQIVRRPPVEGILTRSEMATYLDQVGVQHRNGRLTRHDLTPVSGGWNGRTGALLEPAAEAWERMREAASEDGIDLRFVDSYRTWEAQHAAHQRFLRGEKSANVLPAGHSEHGVGLAVDITDGSIVDRNDEEWRWLQANARSFGWWPISNETWHWEFRGT